MSKIPNVVWPPRVHYNTFLDIIEDQGFSWGGAGYFAEVYINPQTKRAVKIGDKSDAYFVFAKAVFALSKRKDRPQNPFLPQIYNLTQRSTWYVAEMELLQPLRNGTHQMKAAKRLIGALERVVGRGSCPQDIAAYITKFPPQVWEVAVILSLTLNNRSRSPILDLHKCNLMLRGSQLVVTDPVASLDGDWFSSNP